MPLLKLCCCAGFIVTRYILRCNSDRHSELSRVVQSCPQFWKRPSSHLSLQTREVEGKSLYSMPSTPAQRRAFQWAAASRRDKCWIPSGFSSRLHGAWKGVLLSIILCEASWFSSGFSLARQNYPQMDPQFVSHTLIGLLFEGFQGILPLPLQIAADPICSVFLNPQVTCTLVITTDVQLYPHQNEPWSGADPHLIISVFCQGFFYFFCICPLTDLEPPQSCHFFCFPKHQNEKNAIFFFHTSQICLKFGWMLFWFLLGPSKGRGILGGVRPGFIFRSFLEKVLSCGHVHILSLCGDFF